MPCGFDVDAPRIAELYNDALMFRDARIPGFLYNLEGHANVPCKKCALCEKRCPRSFPLVDLMERAGELFAD
jgi:predicted aldo/keto reductase-like oxidoreductase